MDVFLRKFTGTPIRKASHQTSGGGKESWTRRYSGGGDMTEVKGQTIAPGF